jgi:hypothetical protein
MATAAAEDGASRLAAPYAVFTTTPVAALVTAAPPLPR